MFHTGHLNFCIVLSLLTDLVISCVLHIKVFEDNMLKVRKTDGSGRLHVVIRPVYECIRDFLSAKYLC